MKEKESYHSALHSTPAIVAWGHLDGTKAAFSGSKGGGVFDRARGMRGMRGERPRGVVERQVTLCVASEVVMTRGPNRALKRARGATRRVATGSKVRAKKRTHPTSDRVCGEKKQLVGDERREIKVLSIWGVRKGGKIRRMCGLARLALSRFSLCLNPRINRSFVRGGRGRKGGHSARFAAP